MTQLPMTPAGLAALKAEFEHLRKVEAPAIVDEIEVAREKGDLKENAEYHAAKDRQGQIHGKMKYLKARIARAQVIDPSKLSGDRVSQASNSGSPACTDTKNSLTPAASSSMR